MQALVMRTIASVGSTMEGSGTSSTRTSPAAYMSVARMVLAPGLEVVRVGQTARPAAGLQGGAVNPPQRGLGYTPELGSGTWIAGTRSVSSSCRVGLG